MDETTHLAGRGDAGEVDAGDELDARHRARVVGTRENAERQEATNEAASAALRGAMKSRHKEGTDRHDCAAGSDGAGRCEVDEDARSGRGHRP